MGVAGVAFLYGIISFFKIFAALGKLNAWKKKAVPCNAVVAGIANRQENYKGKKGVTYYQYALDVFFNGAWVRAFFDEVVAVKGSPKFQPGTRTTLLYDPTTCCCKDEEDLKGDVKTNVITLVFCIVVFIGCILLVQLING